jgi:hypothetical protein
MARSMAKEKAWAVALLDKARAVCRGGPHAVRACNAAPDWIDRLLDSTARPTPVRLMSAETWAMVDALQEALPREVHEVLPGIADKPR